MDPTPATGSPAGNADEEHSYHEEVQAHERRLLRLIAGGAPLGHVLGELCRSLEQLAGRALRAAFLLEDRAEGRFQCAAAPSLPDAFAAAVSALSLGDPSIPCVRALATREPAIVGDIAAEPEGCTIARVAHALGFTAVWSFPILVEGEAVATLALFPASPAVPDEGEMHLIGFATELASIALAHARRERKLRQYQDRLELMARAAHVGMWDTDLATGRSYYSPEWKRQLGYEEHEISDRHEEWLDRLHPEDRSRVLRRVAEVIETGQGDFAEEFRLRHKDGGYRWILSCGSLFCDARGRPARMAGCHIDVTEREQILEALRRSELDYRRLLVNNPLPVWIFDPESLRFLAASDGACALTGFSRKELMALTVADMRPAEEREVFQERLRQIAETGEQGSIGLWHTRRRDGSFILTRIVWGAVDYQGRPARIAFLQDVTEQMQAERALRAREQDYRQLFRANPHPMYIFDARTLEILEANDAACAQYGYGREAFLALTARDLRPAAEVPRFLEDMRAAEGSFVLDAGIWRHKRRDGSEFPVRVTHGPIRYGEREARIVLARDVTAQLRVEERIRELNATLEERVAARTAALEAANRELDAFNFSVSHDLRTPLRAIDGFSQALIEEEAPRLSETGQDYLRRMRAATRRMADLIDAMYRLSRLTRLAMQVRELDLSALAQAAVEELRQGDPGREVEVLIAPDLRAEGDANLMHVVVANLIGNAWKYTGRTEGARIEFGITADASGGTVYFVRDNGAGFDMQFSDKLFKLFHRLHRDEEFAGHGVGLATVQRIVRRHGGRVWATAEKNRGATFFFTLWENEALRREAQEEVWQESA